MVDHVVGGVGGGVLLDSDLGDMVDLVVDLVANLVDNRSCGNMVVGNRGHGNSRGSLDSSWSSNVVGSRGNSNCGSWGNVMIGNRSNSNSRCSLHLNSLDLSNSRSSNCVVSNNRGSYGDNRGSVGNRINKSILVHIFRESFQGERGIATVGSYEVTNKRGEGARS